MWEPHAPADRFCYLEKLINLGTYQLASDDHGRVAIACVELVACGVVPGKICSSKVPGTQSKTTHILRRAHVLLHLGIKPSAGCPQTLGAVDWFNVVEARFVLSPVFNRFPSNDCLACFYKHSSERVSLVTGVLLRSRHLRI